MAFAVVYAGIYHALDVGSPNWTASRDIIAEVVGTGQKERPNVEDKTKMTNHVFGVIVVGSEETNVCGGVFVTASICSKSVFSFDERRTLPSWVAIIAMMMWCRDTHLRQVRNCMIE